MRHAHLKTGVLSLVGGLIALTGGNAGATPIKSDPTFTVKTTLNGVASAIPSVALELTGDTTTITHSNSYTTGTMTSTITGLSTTNVANTGSSVLANSGGAVGTGESVAGDFGDTTILSLASYSPATPVGPVTDPWEAVRRTETSPPLPVRFSLAQQVGPIHRGRQTASRNPQVWVWFHLQASSSCVAVALHGR